MKKVLAVSGGVDSMVMLDIFAKKFPREELVVATFDHGTRESSEADVEFVSEVGSALCIPVYRGRAELGAGVSEEKARAARYDFLRKIALRERGEIFTAHHLDDLVETVAINFFRGTGFRGLAPFSSFGVRRPFLDGFLEPEEFGFKAFDKRAILRYAAERGVRFREDPTNASDEYLRNRVRERVFNLDFETKREVFQLWREQREIIREITGIIETILPEDRKYEREWFFDLEEGVSLEILREGLIRAGVSATRPQTLEFLDAIRTYLPGKKFNLPGDKLVEIRKNEFFLN